MKLLMKDASRFIFVGYDPASGPDRSRCYSVPYLRDIFNPEAKRPFYDQVKSLDALLAEANGESTP